jgi:primary-amine oxidase
MSLSNDEAADVISFLHDQPELNLTAVENATSWDNTILVVDLANVKKSDALAYLDGSGQQPQRYAKASISFAATEKPYYQEFLIGPIPVDSTTTYRSYEEVTTKGTSKIT